MTQNFKNAKINNLRAGQIYSVINSSYLTIEDVVFETDNSINNPVDKPSIKVIAGKSIFNNVDEINNGGSDIIINGFTFTGSGPLSTDINIDTAYFAHIEAYNKPTNTFIEIVDKVYLAEGLRFKGLTGNTDVGYNQSAIMENEYSPDEFELVVFKGKGDTDRIRLDTLGSIVLQTGGTSGRVYGESDGVTRMTVDSTNVTMTLPLKINSILPNSTTTLTIGTATFNTSTGNIVGTNNIDSLTLSTNLISEHTADNGVLIDGVLCKDSNVTLNDIYVDNIYEKTSTHGVNIDGVLCKDSNVLATSISVSTFLTNNIAEFTSDHGVTIDSVLCKDGIVSAYFINSTTGIKLNTITPISAPAGINMNGVINFTDGDITTPSGIITASILKASGSINTDMIYEKTLANGINIDGVIIKDNTITCDVLIAGNISGGGSSTTIHNDLLSIQGGSLTERYHITLAEYTNMSNMFTSGDVALNSITEKTDGVNVNGVHITDDLDSVTFNIGVGKKYIFNVNNVNVLTLE
jgi:hypothetical protein